MSKKFAVIDYGMGNIGSVVHSLNVLGAEVTTSNQLSELKFADAYILPGVGAFARAMENIHRLKLKDFLNEQVFDLKKPILGICLGMQLMADSSEEEGFTEGLQWVKGKVVKLAPLENLRIPHVGWNNLSVEPHKEIFKNIESSAHFYFDHSYHYVCEDPSNVIASCSYGGKIASVLQKNNIFATQFHPEKSQRNGLKLLRNFMNYFAG